MIFAARERVAAAVRACAPVAVAALAVWLLLRFPPGRSTFYPRCPIYGFLHLRCPGCGATRALAALLRGHVVEAWHQNALFLLALPICLTYGIELYRRWLRGDTLRWPQPSRAVVFAVFAVAAAFMTVRNLWQIGI
jgi:hypothetical protein